MMKRMEFGKTYGVAACLMIAGFTGTVAAETASGYTYAVVGNSGNPVSRTPTVTTNTVGTYASGKITGTTANNASANFTISDQPFPYVFTHGEGSDAAGFNAATGFAYASFSYTVTVVGPQPGTPVPIDMLGSTYGKVLQSGNTNIYYSDAGTQITLVAPNISNTLVDHGSIGDAPDVHGLFQGNADTMLIGWGHYSGYSKQLPNNFTDNFDFAAPIAAGTTVTVKIESYAQGGLQGAIAPTNIATSGYASALLDPYFSIDPTWAAAHPGYSIVVEGGVGNVPPSVPVPASAWLFATALSTIAMRKRTRDLIQ